MINIQPIVDAGMYTLGTWTSPVLYNSTGNFPADVGGEWGYLSWTEANTGDGCTGYVRIDILDSSDNVLIADIAKNVDGTPSDLTSYSIITSDIKIKVKIYGLDFPTPEVSNLWLNFKNWNTVNVITNTGKNVLLNRTFLAAPTVSNISKMAYGNSQTTNFNEDSTAIANEIEPYAIPDSVTFDSTRNTVTMMSEIKQFVSTIPNGTIFNALGIQTTDPLFCAASRYLDITKDSDYYYRVSATFRIVETPTSRYILTSSGRNVMIDRTFLQYTTYSAPTQFVCGYTGTLLDSMTALDSEIVGPLDFTYTLFDTTANKVLVRAGMNELTGNGSTFNAIAHYNTDTTPILNYAAKMYTDILKTSSYIYQFDTSYRSITPSAIIG